MFKFITNIQLIKIQLTVCVIHNPIQIQIFRGRRGRDRMVVGFTTTCAISVPFTTNIVSSNPSHDEMYSI